MKRQIFLIILFISVFCSFIYVTQEVNSVTNIKDGDLIRNSTAQGDAQFYIYIVKLINNRKFKRLILSPKVFLSYGHLDPNNVIEVDQSTIDIYITSDLVRADSDPNIYKLYPQGDSGKKRWIKTAEKFDVLGYDWDSVYTINQVDRDEYILGSPIENCENLLMFENAHDADKVRMKIACHLRDGNIEDALNGFYVSVRDRYRENFGLLNYSLSFVGLFSVIATFGLDDIIVKELVKNESKRDILLGTAFGLKLFGAVVVLLVLIIAVSLTDNDAFTNTLIFAIYSATIFQSFNVVDFYFRAKVLSKYVVYVNVVGLLVSTIAKIVFVLIEAPLEWFAWLVCVDSVILAIGFVYIYVHNRLPLNKLTFELKTAKQLVKESWPLILSGVAISFYMKVDQVMIKEMLDSQAVGVYAAAVTLSSAWYVIPMVITSSLFPAIVNAKHHSANLYYSRLQDLYTLMVWMALIVALPITVLAPWIINSLFGESYALAAGVLSVHIWLGLFINPTLVRGKEFVADNMTYIITVSTLIGAVLNILANSLLIPKYGIMGAAWATLLARSTTFFFVPMIFPKYVRLNTVFFKSLYFSRYLDKN